MQARVRIRRLKENLSVDSSKPVFEIAGENAGDKHVHLATELTGLADPVVEANTKSPGGRPGQRLLSTRFAQRSIVFRVTILGDPENIYERESAWRSVWSYTGYTEMEYTVGGHTRVIRLRLEDYELDMTYDPAVQGAVDVVMSVVADDPFWYDQKDLAFVQVPKDGLERKAVGDHGPVFPALKFKTTPENRGGLTLKVTAMQGSLGRSWTYPTPDLEDGAEYTVDFDPGARQWQSEKDPNVWNRMNGVRYEFEGTEEADAISVWVSDPAGVTACIAVPYLRPWR